MLSFVMRGEGVSAYVCNALFILMRHVSESQERQEERQTSTCVRK